MSSTVLLILFGASVGWILYVYLGYPLLLWLLATFRFRPTRAFEDFTPTLSVLIAARNEEKDIGWKIAETLAWDYPRHKLQVLVASDASEDATDEILQQFTDPRFIYVRMEKRGGKNAALNRLSQLATGEILLFSDANSHMDPSCARRMTVHFADPAIGCVTGLCRTYATDHEAGLASGENAYGGYESKINQLESRLGSVLVCNGSIFAIRRSLFSSLDPEIANDLELPVRIGGIGYRVIFESTARTTERVTAAPAEEFKRRRRICGQGILGMWRLRSSLRHLRLWQFISHKFLRWLTLIPVIVAISSSALLANRSIFFLILSAAGMAIGVLACIGWLLAFFGRTLPRVFAVPFYFFLINLGAVVGVIEVCFGRRFKTWDIAAQSRGGELEHA